MSAFGATNEGGSPGGSTRFEPPLDPLRCPSVRMLAHSGDIPRFCEFQPEFAPFGDGQLVGHRLARELFENPRGGSALGDPPTQIDGGGYHAFGPPLPGAFARGADQSDPTRVSYPSPMELYSGEGGSPGGGPFGGHQ